MFPASAVWVSYDNVVTAKRRLHARPVTTRHFLLDSCGLPMGRLQNNICCPLHLCFFYAPIAWYSVCSSMSKVRDNAFHFLHPSNHHVGRGRGVVGGHCIFLNLKMRKIAFGVTPLLGGRGSGVWLHTRTGVWGPLA